VQDPAVVGQIHGCPKCGGMVMLSPPAGWSPEGQPATSAAPAKTPTKAPPAETPATPNDATPNDATPNNDTPSDDTLGVGKLENAAPDFAAAQGLGPALGDSILMPANPASSELQSSTGLPSSTGPQSSTGASVNDADASLAAPTESAGAAAAPAGSPFVIAPAEATGRWVATAVGLGGTLVVVVASLVVWGLGGENEPASSATATANAQPPAETNNLAPPAAAQDAPPQTPPAQGSSAQGSPPPELVTALKPPQADATEDAPDAAEPATDAAELPPAEDGNEPPGALPAADEIEPPAPPHADETDEPAAPPLAFDPLDLDPDSLDLILIRGPRAAQPPPEAEAPAAPDAADELANRLAHRADPQPPEAALDNRLGVIAQNARAIVRRGPSGPPTPAPVDPLAMVIPEIAIADMPLDRALRLLGELTGMSITIDPAALAFAAVPADHKVSLRGTNITIAELILQSAGPLRLELEERGEQWIVRRSGAEKVRAKPYPFDDLLPAGGNAQAMADLLQTLLPDLRAKLQVKGKQISIDGPAADHMRVAIFCERLRMARGLKPRSRYPQSLLRTTPAVAHLQPMLDRKTTFTFVAQTPVSEIFEHWRRTTGLVILVDWASLADIDLTPRSTIACSVNDRPWRDALDGVLGELSLGWRMVDDRTLQITTATVAATALRSVEFYPLDDVRRVEPLRDASQAWKSAPAFYFDDASNMLIVSATSENHCRIWRMLNER